MSVPSTSPAAVPMSANPVLPLSARSPWQRVSYLARRAWQIEVGVWTSLYRFVFRRPRVPAGASAFTYHQPVIVLLIVFLAVSVIELVAVDLLTQPWPWVRFPLLVLGLWGVTWMLGYLLGYLTRPQPWEAIHSVRLSQYVAQDPKAPKIADEPEGRALHLRMQQATNVEIVLDETRRVRLPQGVVAIDLLRFHTDEPRDFMQSVVQHADAYSDDNA